MQLRLRCILHLLLLIYSIFLLSLCLELLTIMFYLTNGCSDPVKDIFSAVDKCYSLWFSIAVCISWCFLHVWNNHSKLQYQTSRQLIRSLSGAKLNDIHCHNSVHFIHKSWLGCKLSIRSTRKQPRTYCFNH